MEQNSIFDVASITKVIPTSSLALQLIDRGQLSLTDKLIRYVPEFRNTHREQVTIRHLLTQTLSYEGGFRLSVHKKKTPQQILDLIFTTEFDCRPGKKYCYTNSTSILIGLVIEKILGMNLEEAGQEYFFKPLGMDHTTFETSRFKKENSVPTEHDETSGIIQGKVHDESAARLSQKQYVGSAGLFSTVPDLLRFLEILLAGGTYRGTKYFSESMIEKMSQNQSGDPKITIGLGWELNQDFFMGTNHSDKTIGKTGFTGCSIVCDFKKGAGFVILSNHIFPRRPESRDAINDFRKKIADHFLS